MVIDGSFLEIGIILVLAAVVGSLARLLKQPLIVAFIIVGILAGPTGLGLVSSEDEVRLLAKLGIAILLFLVGLKLDIHLIRATGLVALLTGVGQVVFTSLVGFLIVLAFGFDVVAALYIAVALTFSSTIIIVKLLGDKRELDTLHGRIAVGFLIVQDILVVVAMVVIVTIGQPGETSAASELLITFAGSIAFLLTIALLSRYVIPRVLNWMASSPELTLLFGVAWAVALAAVSAMLGLSMEIGAFVAGVSLASTAYRESLGARMVSLRDILILFFFIELGAMLTFTDAVEQLWPAIVLSLFVLIGNPIIVMVIMGAMGYRSQVSFRAGLVVAQISEFSLILIALGFSLGQVDQSVLSLVTLVGIITITVSTYFILYSDQLYSWLKPGLRIFERSPASVVEEERQAHPYDAIVVGAGRMGSEIVKGLVERKAVLLVIDIDPQALRRVRKLGVETLYGDVSDPEFSSHLPLNETQTVICAVPESTTNLVLLDTVRSSGFTGKLCLTALDDRTADVLKDNENVSVIRPLQMAANHVVDGLGIAVRAEKAKKPNGH
jgi:Kef-type K+ transport system membrane component KefB